MSESELREIALELKSQDTSQYQRTFICYYLPGMTAGAGAWATTHFDPDLNVVILGLSAEQEQLLSRPPATDPLSHREVVGRWLDETPFVGRQITIVRENGRLLLEEAFAEGGSLKREVMEKPATAGRRFELVEGSIAGDYWLIDSHGALQIRDEEGLISTARLLE